MISRLKRILPTFVICTNNINCYIPDTNLIPTKFNTATSYPTLSKRSNTNLFSASNKRDYHEILETAKHAAKKAGELMLETYGNVDVLSTKANVRDIVTEVDIQCQEIIKGIIMEKFPQDLFLGEEADEDVNDAIDRVGNDKLLWIVDPIDGMVLMYLR